MAEGTMLFWAKIQWGDGSFDEWYPYEHYYIDGLEEMIANYKVNCLKKELKLSGRLKVFDFGCGDGLFGPASEFFPFF